MLIKRISLNDFILQGFDFLHRGNFCLLDMISIWPLVSYVERIPLIPYPILRIIFYVVYSMKWTQESWLHTRCKLPRDVVTMVLWSRAIFTYFWFKKWRIISTAPKLIKFWSLLLGWLFRDFFRLQIWRRKFTLNLNDRIHSNGDNSVMVDRGKTSAFKFILQPCNWFQPDSTSFNQIPIFALGASNSSNQLQPATIIGLQCGIPHKCSKLQLSPIIELNKIEPERTRNHYNQWKPMTTTEKWI